MVEYLPRLIGISREPGHIPALALLPLRLFAGVTFVYAGLQKLTDPQFFSPTAPGFIGHQMSGYLRAGSPLSPLLAHLAIPHAAQFGALIAFAEIWVGLSALTGLLTRLGAAGGFLLSMTFFLTASWTVRPYFLGPDLPYALCWLTLALGGPTPYSLDDYFFGALARGGGKGVPTPAPIPAPGKRGRTPVPRPSAAPRPLAAHVLARDAFVRGLGTALALAVGSGAIGGLLRLRTGNKVFGQTGAALPSAHPTPAAASGGEAGAPPAAPAGYTYLGNVKVLPVNSAGSYTDPISGDPAMLVHLPNGRFVAYDAVCTHAGCQVDYDPTQHYLVCPCHGATYDPAHGAQVLVGPATQPLATLDVRIDGQGNAYAKASSQSNSSPSGQGNSNATSGES